MTFVIGRSECQPRERLFSSPVARFSETMGTFYVPDRISRVRFDSEAISVLFQNRDSIEYRAHGNPAHGQVNEKAAEGERPKLKVV